MLLSQRAHRDGVVVVFGSLGFYFDGSTIFVRSLIPPHGVVSQVSWQENLAQRRKRSQAYYNRVRARQLTQGTSDV